MSIIITMNALPMSSVNRIMNTRRFTAMPGRAHQDAHLDILRKILRKTGILRVSVIPIKASVLMVILGTLSKTYRFLSAIVQKTSARLR